MMKKITVIGGGTGTFVVLFGLKHYPLDLRAIVSMMDSGGSTGRLRDQLGVLPPGDLRQCLLALSEAPDLWRKLFLYRFKSGDLKGHNFGNLFLSALEKVTSNYQEVIDTASFVLKTKGKVIPVTFKKTHLVVEYENGKSLKGEGKIDENVKEKTKIINAFLDPKVGPNHRAIKDIEESDFIIIGPGDLYTSIIPVLLVNEVKKALSKTKAKIIFILNLMTKAGQTTDYRASDHINDIERYMGRSPDITLINNGKIDKDIIEWYKNNHEKIVNDNLDKKYRNIRLVRDDLIDKKPFKKDKADRLVRSVLRHDSIKLAKKLKEIIS